MTSFFLLGDSISMHYGPFLAEHVRSFGTLARKEGSVGDLDIPEGQNGGDSGMCLRYLKARFAEPEFRFDWLLLNCGLHDIKCPPTGESVHQVELSRYRENLSDILSLARERRQRLCWIRTTPVFEEVHTAKCARFRRFTADVERYNRVADELFHAQGVPVIDLYGFTLPYGTSALCDQVHFTDAMRRLQAAYLAGHLERLAREGGTDGALSAAGGAPVPEALIQTLESARRTVVVSHVKPDGDAFGSALALAGFLQASGRSAVAVGLEPVPDTYAFLSGLKGVIPAGEFRPEDGDLLAICDCGALDRIPAALRPVVDRLPSVCIDHHKTNSGFSQVAYVDPAASSTAEMVWRVARKAGWPLTPDSAEALWVGLVTDTGRFAYDNTSSETLRCAADLVGLGRVRTSLINEKIYGQVSEARLRLQGLAIASLERACDGRVALIHLAQEDYAACGSASMDSENFVDLARSIQGVEVAAFLYAGEGGRVSRLSLRSLPPYDAGAFCLGLGGGGHARAAGATLPMPMAEARAEVLRLLAGWIAGEAPSVDRAGERVPQA